MDNLDEARRAEMIDLYIKDTTMHRLPDLKGLLLNVSSKIVPQPYIFITPFFHY